MMIYTSETAWASYNSSSNMEEKVVVFIQEFSQPPLPPASIFITVDDPQLQDSHFTYRLYGNDREGTIDVRRRYSDFDLLRKKLSQRWLGIYVPPISGKRADKSPLHFLKMFESNMDEAKYVETRKRFLRYFCQGVAIRPYLYYCDLFQQFLRGGSDFESTIAPFVGKEYSFLLDAYQQSFSLLTSTQNEDLLASNEKQLNDLKSSDNLLHSICEKICRASESREEFNGQLNVCMGKSIPEYEEKVLLNHLNRNRAKLILGKSEAFAEKFGKLLPITAINPLDQFLEMAVYEIRENKAFIEAIEGRKEAEKRKCELVAKIGEKEGELTKLEKGEFSFRSLFKGGSKELQVEELQLKVSILRKEVGCLEKMIVKMMANNVYQLEEYRMRRGREYSQVFKTVAEQELVVLAAFEELMQIPSAALE